MGLSGSDIARLSPSAQRQIMSQLQTGRRMKQAATETKYHNRKTIRAMPDGSTRTFDSAKEAMRYDDLILRLKAGTIRDLRLQPQFTLQESFVTADGKRVQAIRYVADFAYYDLDRGADVVEDVKGVKTATYKMKRKMLMERYGIEVEEV